MRTPGRYAFKWRLRSPYTGAGCIVGAKSRYGILKKWGEMNESEEECRQDRRNGQPSPEGDGNASRTVRPAGLPRGDRFSRHSPVSRPSSSARRTA